MKRRLFVLLISTILLSAGNLYANNIKKDASDPRVEIFKSSVKSVDEFMQRFNGNEFHPGLDKKNPDYLFFNFGSLFNYGLSAKAGYTETEFINEVRKIYESVLANNTKLSFGSKNWYAIQEVVFKKKDGKNEKLSFVLQTDSTETGMAYWSIVSVVGMSDFMPADTLKRFVISPEQNEMDFQELYSAFQFNKKDFSRFLSKKIDLDPVSYCMALIENDVWKFDQLGDLTYYFFDVPGYIFKVEFLDRLSTNCGWLITEFIECDDQSKELHRLKLLGK